MRFYLEYSSHRRGGHYALKASFRRFAPKLGAVLLFLATLPSVSTPAHAQAPTRTFTEAGKSLQGKFLQYWLSHGGLAQQGLPISSEISERSDTDGKTYTVQYFERAVFEYHPETAPNDVLLSLLGSFAYQQRHPSGAAGQQPNNTAGSVLFPETGKRLGGIFLQYWQTHGGLAQQGLPISDEFVERSPTDGKEYRVQYFERAAFEYHPENAAPNDVLLSLLGALRYQEKHRGDATGQIPNTEPGTVKFSQTGKSLGAGSSSTGKHMVVWRNRGCPSRTNSSRRAT